MEKETKKVPFWEILKTLIIFIIAFIVVIFVAKLINSLFIDKENPIQPTTRKNVECPADFLSYQSLIKKTDHAVYLIADRKTMFATNGEFVNSQIVLTKSETEESKVACGYLSIRTGTETNGSLQSWEDVYVNPNGFGGHLVSDNQFGLGDGGDYSEYVFSLSNIEYWRTRTDRASNNLSKADWATLLNVQDSISFNVALNTEDRTGFIDQLSIAYKCWNPKTGEENNGCKINVIDKSDTKSTDLN